MLNKNVIDVWETKGLAKHGDRKAASTVVMPVGTEVVEELAQAIPCCVLTSKTPVCPICSEIGVPDPHDVRLMS
jgi:hypothetical protein